MKTHEALPGTEITSQIEEIVNQANLYNEPVSMVFNGVELVACPGDTVPELLVLWNRDLSRRSEEYRKSLDGKRAEREREDRRKAMQRAADNLMKRLETLDYTNLDELIQFFDDLSDPSDHIGVSFNRSAIATAFMEHGFIPNANTGKDFDEEDRENYARYLIGQALDGLMLFGIHGMYHTWAQKWRDKFALASNSC